MVVIKTSVGDIIILISLVDNIIDVNPILSNLNPDDAMSSKPWRHHKIKISALNVEWLK